MSKSAINAINNLKTAIKQLSSWESSGEAFGFLNSISRPKTDYIYEFFCAIKVLEDLSLQQNVVLKPSSATGRYEFPQKPGAKANFARFEVQDSVDSSQLFQVCLGTEIAISASPLTTFGADISFQMATASENPNERDVIIIMDAKYKADDSSKLDIGTIREFAQCVADMETPKPVEQAKIKFTNLLDLNANCLFTNGEAVANHRQYCINKQLKQVSRFDCDSRSRVVEG